MLRLVCLLVLVVLANCELCTPTSPVFFTSRVYEGWIYSGFTSFQQLHIACDIQTYGSNLFEVVLPLVTFDFAVKKMVDEPIDLNAFAAFNRPVKFDFKGVLGFELGTRQPVILMNQTVEWLFDAAFVFSLGIVDFYLNGALVDESLCDPAVFADLDVKLFSQMQSTQLYFNENMNYKNPACPYVFKNAFLQLLNMNRFRNSRLSTSALSFIDVSKKNNSQVTLNAMLNCVYFQNVYQVDIDTDIVDPYAFKSLSCLGITGKLGSVQPDLFKRLRRVITLDMALDNARAFFHSSDNAWLGTLFSQGRSFENQSAMIDYFEQSANRRRVLVWTLTDSLGAYDYPEEDFCLFRHFPARRAILSALLYSKPDARRQIQRAEPSCTFRYLSQNNAIILDYFNQYLPENYSIVPVNGSGDCDFERLLDVCSLEAAASNDSSPSSSAAFGAAGFRLYLSYDDLVYVFEWLEYIGPILTFPVFAALAFFLNLLVILIIDSKKNHEEKLFESQLFEYIRFNSAFNCVECLIYQFRLVGMCLGYHSVFCSTIRYHPAVQLFDIVFTGCLSEVMKSCSILTNLVFSLQRYVETSKSKHRFLLYFVNVKTKRSMLCIAIFSLLMSSSKYFEYDFGFVFLDSPTPFNLNINYFFGTEFQSIFYLVHYLVNDFLLLLVNLVIDCLLVGNIKQNLKAKHQVELRTTESHSKEAERKLKEKERKNKLVEMKANAMIISTLSVYFFCRLPELAGRLYFFFSANSYCSSSIFCYLLVNSIEYLYMLSYIFNIFFYYKFNRNFRKGFRRFFGLKESKKRRKGVQNQATPRKSHAHRHIV